MSGQDYLLRLIETVGLMLMRLRAMLLGGEIDPTTARDEIHDAAGRAGLDLPFLSSVDGDTLVMLMSPAGEVEPGRCWITAELFLVEGLRLRAEGDEPGAGTRSPGRSSSTASSIRTRWWPGGYRRSGRASRRSRR